MFLKTWQVTVPHVDAEFFLLIGREQYWTWDRERSTSLADVLIIFPGLFESDKKTIETKKKRLYSFDLRGTRWNDKHLM